MNYQMMKLILTLIVAIFIPYSVPQLALTQESSESQESSEIPTAPDTETPKDTSDPEEPYTRIPPAPNTGTPNDTSDPGGTRTESDRIASCQGKQKSITSLTGNEIKELTVSNYPSFWFYVPYTADEIGYLEFVLEDSRAEKIVYQTRIHLSQEAGVMEVALPNQSQYALEQDKNYTWYLKGSCNSEAEPDIALSGWIKRIPLESQLQEQLQSGSQQYEVYLQNKILYDAVTVLAKQYQSQPESPQIKNAWIALLNRLGLMQIADKPIVDLRLEPITRSTTSSPIE
jgi:hypothetical protein